MCIGPFFENGTVKSAEYEQTDLHNSSYKEQEKKKSPFPLLFQQ
jgi:hypothetical protein